MHQYVAEYVYRHNTHHLIGHAISALISNSEGKSLSFIEPTNPTHDS